MVCDPGMMSSLPDLIDHVRVHYCKKGNFGFLSRKAAIVFGVVIVSKVRRGKIFLLSKRASSPRVICQRTLERGCSNQTHLTGGFRKMRFWLGWARIASDRLG